MTRETVAPRLVATRPGADRAEARASRPLPAIAADGPFAFRDRSVLMLQGPVGPFFSRLAQDLRWAGAKVHKINFNGGDWLFFPQGATAYRGRMEDFGSYLERFCREKRIEVLMLFGDCRPVHKSVRAVADRLGVRVEVFEEGYIRPDYITMETHGVNGHSALPRSPIFFLNTPVPKPPKPLPVGPTLLHAGMWAFIYYFAAVALWWVYPHYRHHRPLSWFEGLRWVRGWIRKHRCTWAGRHLMKRVMAPDMPPFFLVPLQVHNDAQVRVHSHFDGVRSFVDHIVRSFAAHAPPETVLVFKHHPMDRAYSNYGSFLRSLAREHGLGDRIMYLHDEHLPTLITRARGLVTINSTAGLSAIHHDCPTIALGHAIYRMDGLTTSLPLERFWIEANATMVNKELYRRFRHHVIHRTQINGNFYRRINIPGSMAGLNWARGRG